MGGGGLWENTDSPKPMKREELKSWPDNNEPQLKRFLKEYDTYLEKRVRSERKRVDARIELQKENSQWPAIQGACSSHLSL